MRLLLLRHGETEDNAAGKVQGHRPGKLSARGIRQAQAAAERLSHETLDVIFSSDLERARQTALEIARLHPRTPLIFRKALRERRLGIYEGGSAAEYFRGLAASGEPRFKFQPAGGESIAQLRRRGDRLLRILLARCSGKNVLLTTHGGLILALLLTIQKLPDDSPLDLHIENASLSIARFAADGTVLSCSVNDTDHLRGLR